MAKSVSETIRPDEDERAIICMPERLCLNGAFRACAVSTDLAYVSVENMSFIIEQDLS